MDPKYYSLIEMMLAFVPILAFACWELYSLRRDKRRREAKSPPDSSGRGDEPQ